MRETDTLFAKIRELTASGVVVLYVSHRLEEIFEISDEVLVLKDGVNVLAAKTREIDRNGLISAMVGRSLAAIYPNRVTRPGPAVLECRGLCRAGVFEGLSFTVHAGEIVGMFGLVGSGRTDVARALFGATPATSGEILVDGAPVRMRRPADAIANGVAFVTEDRKRDGLGLDLSILDNGGLASMDLVSWRGVLNRKRQATIVEAKLDELQFVRAASAASRANSAAATSRRSCSPSGCCSNTPAFSSSTNLRAGSTSPPRSRSTASWRTSPQQEWRSC